MNGDMELLRRDLCGRAKHARSVKELFRGKAVTFKIFGIAASVAIVLESACAPHTLAGLTAIPAPANTLATGQISATMHDGHGTIQHIIIIVQSGRTFENLFAGWPQADAPMTGVTHTGRIVMLKQLSYADDKAMDDGFSSAKMAFNGGKMNDFDLNTFVPNRHQEVGLYPYAFLDRLEIAPYRTMASRYVLSDRMFPTEFGGSFTSNQGLIAGSTFVTRLKAMAGSPDNTPWGCDAPADTTVPLERWGYTLPEKTWIYPCVTQYPTMADSLDRAGVSWKYYISQNDATYSGSHWSAFDAIKNVRFGRDWRNNIASPVSRVLKDAAENRLPAVSWVLPNLAWSDSAQTKSDMGPSWAAAVVNAIGSGKSWNSTVIVVVWSGWGGWYDDTLPPLPVYLMKSGLGIRVPCIIISPYVRKGVVSHKQYQFGSILKYIEQTFKAPPLNSFGFGFVFTDSVANSIGEDINLNQPARRFVPIPAKYPPSRFVGK